MNEISYIYKGKWVNASMTMWGLKDFFCFSFKLSVMHLAFTACIRLKLCLDVANPLRNRFNLQVKFVWSKEQGKNTSGRQCFAVDIGVWWNYVKLAQTTLGIAFLWNQKTTSYHFLGLWNDHPCFLSFVLSVVWNKPEEKISVKYF